MGTGGIFDALKRQAANGVHIQMILDEGQKSNNQRFAKALEDLGAEILWSDPQFQYMHAKVLIVETCARMPYVLGAQESVHLDDVTWVIDGVQRTETMIRQDF